jgi:hypothetical protein
MISSENYSRKSRPQLNGLVRFAHKIDAERFLNIVREKAASMVADDKPSMAVAVLGSH